MGRKTNYDKMTKEEIITREKEKLTEITSQMDEKIQKATASLVNEAAFMGASLFELRKIINEKGYTEVYQNGANQKGLKKSSEVEIYNTMIKNYQATIKQLTDLIPKANKDGGADDGDDFNDFLREKYK